MAKGRLPDDAISDFLQVGIESMEPSFAVAILENGPSVAFRSAYVSGMHLGLEVAIGDIVAGRRLVRWLDEVIGSADPDEYQREYVGKLRELLSRTP